MYVRLYKTVMALVGFCVFAFQALTYQNGGYMGLLYKKVSGAQCFIMAFNRFVFGYRDWPTLNQGLIQDFFSGCPCPHGIRSET